MKLLVILAVLAMLGAAQNPAEEIIWIGDAGVTGETLILVQGLETRLELLRGRERIVIGRSAATSHDMNLVDFDNDGDKEIVWRESWEDGPGSLAIYTRAGRGYRRAYLADHGSPLAEFRRTRGGMVLVSPSPALLAEHLRELAAGNWRAEDLPLGFIEAAGDRYRFRTMACSAELSSAFRQAISMMDRELTRAGAAREVRLQTVIFSKEEVSGVRRQLAKTKSVLAAPCR